VDDDSFIGFLERHWPGRERGAEEARDELGGGPSGRELRTLGRFAIRRRLASGGFATVYLAYDRKLGREVALKIPHPETARARARGSAPRPEAFERAFGTNRPIAISFFPPKVAGDFGSQQGSVFDRAFSETSRRRALLIGSAGRLTRACGRRPRTRAVSSGRTATRD
jgi:hypothetical protein